MSISLGVPQGSVVGPILFIMYINKYGKSIEIYRKIRLFVDDTLIYITGDDYALLMKYLNEVLNNISIRLKKNKQY